MTNSLAGRDLLSIDDLNKAGIKMILDQATQMEEQCQEQPKLDLLNGRILATLFYEPSTRTRLSFESAMHRLGGDVLSAASAAKTSSAAKGETLGDAARVISGYAHLIVQRHPEILSAKQAAEGATVPVINAGDGSHEHPTQALLDLYTIQKERGQIDGLRIAMAGDLRYGRTVHSLSKALAHWDVTLTLVSPPSLQMPPLITHKLKQKITVDETEDLTAVMEACDVLYVTRIQRERFQEPADYDKVKDSYVITRKLVNSANPEITIMHPLPRVNEIATDVDELPGAAYFRQADNGVWARMALMALILDTVG
ncbi:MAG: aspartate carbamoyltransferase [Anaerolineae bacterium]|nr:aspartate carbamoyltransferase [Anaerolineae bacterium]